LTFNWATRTSMTSVEKEIRYMERMTELLPNKPRPPIISVDAGGAIPHDKTNAPNRSWVIAPLTMGDYIISKQGFRVRQEFTVALWDYRPESILQGAQRLPDRPVPRTYKVVSGDNLLKIAAYFYGDQARWHDIASLNKITDPMHLKVGTTLKMPPATPTSTKAAS
jgi:nucleoid-associated protein YgaU